jgi:hypothetical protein
MAGNVIRFPVELLKADWEQLFEHECSVTKTSLHVYVDKRTGAVDIVQCNAEGEAITTHLQPHAGASFRQSCRG